MLNRNDWRAMRVLLVLICLLTVAVLLPMEANSENYGCISKAQCAQMERIVHKWFDRTGNAGTMICIMYRESGGNPRAYNDDWRPYRSVAGLFQIEWRFHATPWERNAGYDVGWWHFYKRVSDPVQNVKLAYRLYKTSGLSPWGGGC